MDAVRPEEARVLFKPMTQLFLRLREGRQGWIDRMIRADEQIAKGQEPWIGTPPAEKPAGRPPASH